MANNKPPIGRRFEPGNRANPKGAAAHNPEVKRLKRMTQEQVAEIGATILEGTLDQIQAIAKDKQSSVLKVWIAAVAVKAINRGDASALNVIMDRIVGKPKETLDLNSNNKTEFTGESMAVMKNIIKKIEDEI